MSLKDDGVDATMFLCSSGDTKWGTAVIRFTAGIVDEDKPFLGLGLHGCDTCCGLLLPLPTIMAPQNPESAALLAHIVSQLEANVEFLASQNYISHSDASSILSKLPNLSNNNPNAINAITPRFQTLTTTTTPTNPVAVSPPAAPRIAPPTPQIQQARALWAYNENGQVEFSTTSPELFDKEP